jgi:hypothetical protein
MICFSCRNLEDTVAPIYSASAHKEIINSIDGVGGQSIGCGAPEIVTGSRDGEMYKCLRSDNRTWIWQWCCHSSPQYCLTYFKCEACLLDIIFNGSRFGCFHDQFWDILCMFGLLGKAKIWTFYLFFNYITLIVARKFECLTLKYYTILYVLYNCLVYLPHRDITCWSEPRQYIL